MKRHLDALINHLNYRETCCYLEHCEEVLGNSKGTRAFKRTAMNRLLEWGTDIRFPDAPKIRPTLPRYLAEFDISVTYHAKLLAFTRQFFKFAIRRWPGRYERIDPVYLDSLRSNLKEKEIKRRKIYSLGDVHALVAVPPRSLTEERIQAAVAFLFLSGMRVGAFVTLPLRAIHWDQKPVQLNQYPALGVRTKGQKAADTYLLPHPELEDLRVIAGRWYRKVKTATRGCGFYYTTLTPDQEFDPVQVVGEHRSGNVRRHLRKLCQRAGMEYLSPHRLRHGHTVWAMDKAVTRADMKAISQNLMHASLETTDRIYARMVDDDVAKQLNNLGKKRYSFRR